MSAGRLRTFSKSMKRNPFLLAAFTLRCPPRESPNASAEKLRSMLTGFPSATKPYAIPGSTLIRRSNSLVA